MSTPSTSGWNRPRQDAPKVAAKKPSAFKGALAGVVIVAVLGVVCWYMLMGGGSVAPKAGRPAKTIKEVKPAKVAKPKTLPKKKVEHPKNVEDALSNVGDLAKPEIKKRELTPEEWYKITNRVFSSGTEQLMSWVFTKQLGEMPIPIPNIDPEEKKNIVGILISKNEIKEGDSENTAHAKEAVAMAKEALMEYLKEGGDPDEFLQYYSQQQKDAFEYRIQIKHQVDEIIDGGDLELARDFVGKANELLREKGIIEFRVTDFGDLKQLVNDGDVEVNQEQGSN